MGENSNIQWTDHTFNPWRGCQKVSNGCKNCYADQLSKRNPGTLGVWGSEASGATRVVASEAMWKEPVKWNREAKVDRERWSEHIAELDMPAPPSYPKHRPRVFCASLGDVFEDWTGAMVNAKGDPLWIHGADIESTGPWHSAQMNADWRRLTMSDVRARLFRLIDATPNLDWLIVTKRPENIRKCWPVDDCDGYGKPFCAIKTTDGKLIGRVRRDNVWLLTSVENQEQVDNRIPELLKCRDLSPVLGLSCEPLLGPVDLLAAHADCPTCIDGFHDPETGIIECSACESTGKRFDEMLIDWVICGGESGPNARPCNVNWIRSLRDQCQDVAYFNKQLGSKCVDVNGFTECQGGLWPDGSRIHVGKTLDDTRWIQLKGKGGDPSEWPEDLRVRQFPNQPRTTAGPC